MLTIGQEDYESIRRHGEEVYPLMSCGVLSGHFDGDGRRVSAVLRCKNTAEFPHHRFQIDPREIIAVQRERRLRGEEIVGFYYSDTSDIPGGDKAMWSKTTLAESHYVGCSYVITSVLNGKSVSTRSFELSGTDEEDKKFLDEKILVVDRAGHDGVEFGADLSDADLWARLSASARGALARADGVRRVVKKDNVHTYHLIAGLFPAWKGFFARAGVSEDDFKAIVQKEFGTQIPSEYAVPVLSKIPPRSKNVQNALSLAAKNAEERGAKGIWSLHLLYGALSLTKSQTVNALRERGVRREDIWAEDVPADEREALLGQTWVGKEGNSPSTREQKDELLEKHRGKELGSAAAPAAKVDSDLWCEKDRLGYEAYARTIAGLITHKETVPPLTIGIKAPWGAGKTSLMKRVQHLLDGKAKLSEENRAGARQQWQAPQITLLDVLRELKRSTGFGGLPSQPSEKEKAQGLPLATKRGEETGGGLPLVESDEGKAYGLPARTTVWFNAWKYQTSEQIWAGMAHCIISQVTARMGPKDREIFWLRLHARRVNADEVRWRVWEAVLRQVLPFAVLVFAGGALLFLILLIAPTVFPVFATYLSVHPRALLYLKGAISLTGILSVAWKIARKLGDKAAGTIRELVREPDYEGKMGYLHLVESDIEAVLDLASVTREHPLVVFVDDLDRCSPNKVAEVAEAINLFLCGDYPNCIFVLGMEPGMVAAALEVANKDVIKKAQEMGLVDKNALLGWRFMEKIVQLPIMIPPPTEPGRNRYVGSLSGMGDEGAAAAIAEIAPQGAKETSAPPVARPTQHGAAEEAKVQEYVNKMGPAASSSEVAKKSLDVVAEAPDEERWAALEAGNRVYEQALTERDPVVARFARKVALLVDGNPRQIKRYVNVFRFYSTLRHRMQLGGLGPDVHLPSDEELAKFVTLSIRWPHAMDCLRVRVDGGGGKEVSLLKSLETESRKLKQESATLEEEWKNVVHAKLGMPSWAEERAFREFLAEGESLCGNEGHGLW